MQATLKNTSESAGDYLQIRKVFIDESKYTLDLEFKKETNLNKNKIDQIINAINSLLYNGNYTDNSYSDFKKNNNGVCNNEIPTTSTSNELNNLFFNNYNFPGLQKVLLKNLTKYGTFDFKGKIEYCGLYDFDENKISEIFESDNITENNKKKFMSSIFDILKKRHLRKYLVDGYSKADARKQKKALEKEIYENHYYIEDEIKKLQLSKFSKYFPSEFHNYTLKNKIGGFFKKYFSF